MIGYHGRGTTILAVASPPGKAPRGILRVSGPDAWGSVASLLDDPDQPPPRGYVERNVHLDIIQNSTPARIAWMPGPGSYTREDVVEIHTYGSPVLLSMISDALQARGVYLAGPGEFTRRAFLNGRIDLTQAEAVLSLIHAQDETAHRQAYEHLRGTLYERILQHKEGLVRVCAFAEAAIDFSDQDIEVIDHEWVTGEIRLALSGVTKLLDESREAPLAKEGVRTLLAGRPNVGKSSLLNRLVGSDTAIVSSIAGTTRDVVEGRIVHGGIQFILRDTAGVRQTQDELESAGVERTMDTARSADLILFIMDASQPGTDEDIQLATELSEGLILPVLNKCDLDQKLKLDSLPDLTDRGAIKVSAATGEGIQNLIGEMVDMVESNSVVAGPAFTVNSRQRGCLIRAQDSLARALESAGTGESLEFLSMDLRDALDQLGEVVGEVITDDLLDVIFSEFCIGK